MSSGTEFNNDAVDLRRPLDKQTLARLTTMHDGYAWLGVFSAVGTVAAAVTVMAGGARGDVCDCDPATGVLCLGP